MKQINKPLTGAALLCVVSIGVAAFSGVKIYKQLPLIEHAVNNEALARKLSTAIKEEATTEALLCVKNGGTVKSCQEKRVEKVVAADKRLPEFSKRVFDEHNDIILYSITLFFSVFLASLSSLGFGIMRRLQNQLKQKDRQISELKEKNAEVQESLDNVLLDIQCGD